MTHEIEEKREDWRISEAPPPPVEIPLVEELPYEVRVRSQVLRRLEGVSKRAAKKQAAKELGLHESSIYRLKSQYKKKGIEGLKRQDRSDKGDRRVSEEWQEYIIKTYRQGNRGTRQMSRSQVAKLVESHAAELGEPTYPSRRSVYRILADEIAQKEKQQKKRQRLTPSLTRTLGWQGEQHQITTRAGTKIDIEYSNQVWQCDHTQADILVVDTHGEVLGRPNLTTVIDTYSRCIVGIHLGMEKPSAAVTCLALRHAILPKQYRHSYAPRNLWETYGMPEYLYTDGGTDFTSEHLEQVASRLGIVLELRRRPAEGGIVERPFGTLNSEFFSTLPGYTTRRVKPHLSQVKADARLTLEQLEGLIIRYIADNYNQQPDSRTSKESRQSRWQSNLRTQGPVMAERELDQLLMRQDKRRVYQGGYIRFANLIYRGEYLAGYGGETVALRYDPRDITTVYVYVQRGSKEVFLSRAHAQNLETERLSLAEAKAISRRLRGARREITNQSVLTEIRERIQFVDAVLANQYSPNDDIDDIDDPDTEDAPEAPSPPRPIPKVRVYDYDQLRRDHGL